MKINTVEVLYEDDDVVVFNKPAGLMVHADGRSTEYTLADYVRDTYPHAREVGEPLVLEKGTKNELVVHRPGIVHRLDKDTSGAIIVAKKQNIFLYLKRQFKDHEIKKVYRALVIGRVKNDTGLIDSPLARSKSDFRLRTTVDLHTGDARGALREAVTRYKVLERFSALWKEKDYPLTLVEVYPLTGRTHQIRAHFRSIRHPLLGDSLYGPQKKKEEVAFGAPRTMLHSYKITFSLPEKGEIELTAPVPQDFEDILAKNR
jgi:23S rRNA pseudouridine1911/1915/1917 synthase